MRVDVAFEDDKGNSVRRGRSARGRSVDNLSGVGMLNIWLPTIQV